MNSTNQTATDYGTTAIGAMARTETDFMVLYGSLSILQSLDTDAQVTLSPDEQAEIKAFRTRLDQIEALVDGVFGTTDNDDSDTPEAAPDDGEQDEVLA